jgi:twitching motility two-component system response regulator PilG
LIKILDQITVNEFRFIPDAMIGDHTAPDPALQTGPTHARRFRAGRPKVLVVDDALVVRTQMQALLEMHQVEAVLAANAEKAIELVRTQGPFAMIFLDVVMQGMDGYTACRRLKSLDRVVPVILLTGKDSAFDKIRGVMAGCNRYLTKPIAVNDLSAVLQEFLDKEFFAPQVAQI